MPPLTTGLFPGTLVSFMDLYTEHIIDLSKHPLNKRVLTAPTLTAAGVNTTCGDHLRLYLRVEADRVTEATWEGDGCAISTAAASVLTEEIRGKSLKELTPLSKDHLFEWLELKTLGPARVKCVTLCLETLQTLLSQPQ